MIDKDMILQPIITTGAVIMNNLSECLTVVVLVLQALYISIKICKERKK